MPFEPPESNVFDQDFNYIRRRGRFTRAQALAFEELAEAYRFKTTDLDGLDAIGIEIGFGMGLELIAWAEEHPELMILGVELYQPGIGSMLSRAAKQALKNIRLVDEPAQSLLARLPPSIASEIRIFFPDPWPKKRHHKRRLIQLPFLDQLDHALASSAVVHLATDWAEYGEWMAECFAQHPGFELLSDQRQEEPRRASASRPGGLTKFEARGARLGHTIRDLRYRKLAGGDEGR